MTLATTLNTTLRKLTMAQYTSISLAEMDSALRSDKGWTRAVQGRGREYVYSYTLKGDSGIQIKVWSSIHVENSQARGVGRDAIRVCAVRGNYGYIKSTRVHRVLGWRDNLRNRVMTVIREAKERYKRESSQAAPTLNAVDQEAIEFLTRRNHTWDLLRSFADQWRSRQRLSARQWEILRGAVQRERERQINAARRVSRGQTQEQRREARLQATQTSLASFGRGGELVDVIVDDDPWG